jgi:hypothetical protein
MQEIKLPIKVKKDGEESIVTKTFVIEDLSFGQFTALLKVLSKAFDELKADGEMNAFLENVFGAEIDPDSPQEMLDQLDNEFLVKAMGAFEFIAVKLPERFLEIMAVLSDIDKEVLREQKMVKIADVYDAVIEANDLEVLIARLKKSLGATKTAMKFLNLRKKVTQQ